MAVPKKKTPSGRRNRRRANKSLRQNKLGICPQCQTPIPSHQACPECGFYKGRDVLKLEDKKTRQEAKKKARKDRAKAR